MDIDGEFWAELDGEVVLKNGLARDQLLPPQRQQELLAEDAFIRGRRAAAILLNTRPRSEYELRNKLREKEFDPATIDRVIEYFRESGKVDDAEFARIYARSQLKNRKQGPGKVAAKLRRLGVGEKEISLALQDQPATDEDEQRRRAEDLAEKRLARMRSEDDPAKVRRKLTGALMRAGFDPSITREVLDAAMDRWMREQAE